MGSFGGSGGGVGSLGGGVGSLGGGVGSRGSGGFTSTGTNGQHYRLKWVNPTTRPPPPPQLEVTFWSLLVLLIHVLQSLVEGLGGEWHVSEEGGHHPGLLLSR